MSLRHKTYRDYESGFVDGPEKECHYCENYEAFNGGSFKNCGICTGGIEDALPIKATVIVKGSTCATHCDGFEGTDEWEDHVIEYITPLEEIYGVSVFD